MLPHILILAAGDSSRLGQPKQLAKLGGRPALHMTISNAVAVAGQAVTVVVGAHAAALTPMLKRSSASWILNRSWEEGMGSSIRVGIAALPVGCEAVLILLGDQVAVSADDLKRLIGAWNGESTVIAAAQYEQQTGVPAIFPAFCFSELAALRGDQGAKAVLHRHRDRVVRVAMPNAAVDLDTPDDLQILIERFGAAGD